MESSTSVSAAVITGACVFLVAGFVIMSVYFLPRWLLRCLEWNSHASVLWSVQTRAPVCSLTVDDAPSASTAEILDVLKEFKVKATFFIISDQIKGNEHILRRIINEGHFLGNHLTEDRASILDTLHVFEQKLQACDEAIAQFQPEKDPKATLEPLQTQQIQLEDKKDDEISQSKWMRPASGWFTTPMREITQRHGYRICLGSVYPHDAQIRSETVNSLYLRARTSCGSVIIVHDRSWTIGVLKTALPELTRKFTFVGLDELISYRGRGPEKITK